MYYFEAHYYNADNDAEITKKIIFDGQYFCNDRECYMYAMSKAYDMAEKYETLESLELIAC